MSKQCVFIQFFDISNNYNTIQNIYPLLESIYIYGNLNENSEILIYTTTEYMNIIKNSDLFSNMINFETNDLYTSETACMSKLDIFELPSISKYNKIIYLDIKTILKGDLNPLFDLITDNLLYVLEDTNFEIGKRFFNGDETFDVIRKFIDTKISFINGVLLFNNCDVIKQLFKDVKVDIETRAELFKNNKYNDVFFIIYNAYISKLFDNKKLKDYVVNNDFDINSSKTIHYFNFDFDYKIYDKNININSFLNSLKEVKMNLAINETTTYINENLKPIVYVNNEITDLSKVGTFLNIIKIFEDLSKTISSILLNKTIKNILYAEFNYGINILLMLIINPDIVVNFIDFGEFDENPDNLACYNKIKERFGDRINKITSDRINLSDNIASRYDMIFIDTFSLPYLVKQFVQELHKVTNQDVIIINNYNNPDIRTLCDEYVAKNNNVKSLVINTYGNDNIYVKYIPKII